MYIVYMESTKKTKNKKQKTKNKNKANELEERMKFANAK